MELRDILKGVLAVAVVAGAGYVGYKSCEEGWLDDLSTFDDIKNIFTSEDIEPE